ncbi:MAG: hypothetical protein HN521_17020 [Candidatus Latescibacteria bacterium]|nr:hypothetical protein [Candidatus Latescibacterota bacterium]MBT5833175.1 hypothetical protein [Candidatus Latescibacterota bacterium]
MPDIKEICEDLAFVLSYPEASIEESVVRLQQNLGPEDAKSIQPFVDYIKSTRLMHVEEFFTQTFDLNSSCCLEVGWHLYGEDYKRGELLVNMRQTLAEEHLPESTELPDHLSHCLCLLPRLEDEDAEAFARRYLLPAIAKILKALEAENPYTCVIEMLQHLLEYHYGPGELDLGSDAKHMELPLLNNVLHYNNTEDLVKEKRRAT